LHFSLGYDGYISDFMANYVKYSFVAMVIGVGFSLPSIVYEREDLSMPLKVLIHMGTGMIVYFLAVLYAGWIPASLGIGALIISLLIGISIAVVIWFGFYLYYREEALKINKQIKKMNQ
jgi:fatty acid desaturase